MSTLLEMWEEATSDFVERYDRNLMELAELLKSSGGKGRVPWNKIPAARLKRIWLDYGKTLSATTSREGIVRDEKGLEEIADRMLDNIARLRAATEMMGHTPVHAREMLDDMGYTFTDQEWDEWMANYFTDEHGNWTLSDYGLPKLEELYAKIYGAESAEEKLRWIDKALNVVHQRSDLAALFVEGGSETLREIFDQGGYTGEPVGEAFDPDAIDPKAFVRSMDLAGYAMRFDWGNDVFVWRQKNDKWSQTLDKNVRLFATKSEAEKFAREWAGWSEYMLTQEISILPIWRQKDGSLTESEAEEFDPDMPSHKLAKDFALNLDKRGAERIKELEKFNQWQGGDWVIPHTYIGYEADFDNEANHAYFKEKYPWLRTEGQTLGFDDTKFPEEYDSFELFIGQIDQTEWESFIEDVGAVYNGICMDDDKAMELENAESSRVMKDDWLPEIKKQLLVDPRFQEPELQKEIPLLTPDDMWQFAHEYSIYPEREGYGSVTYDIESIIKKIQPEDILGVGKPPKEHPEFKFESRLNEADPDDVDPHAYLGRVAPYWGVAYDGKDDKPGWTVPQRDGGKLVWYTGNPWDRWSLNVEDAKQFKSQEAADSFIDNICTNKAVWPVHMISARLPELWQEALDPDEIDPKEYTGKLDRFYGITWIKNPDAPIFWCGGNRFTGYTWDVDPATAMRFPTKGEAEDELSFLLTRLSSSFTAMSQVDVAPLPYFRTQEALDPDEVDPRHYLRQLKRPLIIVFQGSTNPLYYAPISGMTAHRWSQDVDEAKRFWSTDEAQTTLKSVLKQRGQEFAQIIPDPTGLGEPPVHEALDPDAVDPRAYLKGVLPKYIIRHAGSPYPHQLWWRKSYGWSCQKDKASRFPNPQAAIEFARGGDMEAGYWQRYGRVEVDPVLPGIKEALDPDAIDPHEYLKHLRRGYVARAQAWDAGASGRLKPVSLWFSDDPWGWYASYEQAKVFKTSQEAERARASLPKDKQSLMVVEPHEEIVAEVLDPDEVNPRNYLGSLAGGDVITYSAKDARIWYYAPDMAGMPWSLNAKDAQVYTDSAVAQTMFDHWVKSSNEEDRGRYKLLRMVVEARIQRKQLPPEEEIDYKQWALHGGYDSGTEIYSDAEVRVFRPSTPQTWEKYFGVSLLKSWPDMEQGGPIFIAIPAKGKPWAFREFYDQIVELDDRGNRWDTPIPEMLGKYGGGKTVGKVMATYYKRRLKNDFEKYLPWVFGFGGIGAVRRYINKIKPGQNAVLDNALAMQAAAEGNLPIAARFWNYPVDQMTKEGVWISVADWSDLAGMFKDDRNNNWKKAAETLLGGDASEWFYWLWETPMDVKDVVEYLTPEHYTDLRRILVGRSVLIDGEPLVLTPQALKDRTDDDIEEWIKNADEFSDGNSLDEIAEAIQQAGRRALETIYEDEYTKAYIDLIEDTLGSKSKWIKVGGKDRLGFLVPWKKVRESMAYYEEENSEPYSGDLPDLLFEYSPKIVPNDEYHGSFSDEPDTVKEALSYELGELEPWPLPENRPDPNQPELISGLPTGTGKMLHVEVYNELCPTGATVKMKDYDWEKFKKEKPQETSKEAWDAYAKKHNIKPKSRLGEAVDPQKFKVRQVPITQLEPSEIHPDKPIDPAVFKQGWPAFMPPLFAFEGRGALSLQDGHNRWQAALGAGLKQVPVVTIPWTLAEQWYEEGLDRLDMRDRVFEQLGIKLTEARDPDDIDPRKYLKKVKSPRFVIARKDYNRWWNTSSGWVDYLSRATTFPSYKMAQKHVDSERFDVGYRRGKFTIVIEPYVPSVQEAVEKDITYRETDPEELDKLGVVTEFSDNAFGDFAYSGTHYLILKNGTPVGWFQQLDSGVLQVIEVKPEFQKQGIATEIVRQLYGDEEFRVSDPSEEGKQLFKRFPKHVVETRLEESHSYAVTLIKLPRELADFVVNWGKVNIPDDWLYTEEDDDSYGRELEPHVTVKYGLTTNQVPDELRKIAATTRPFPVFFEKVSLFGTNPDYDVVKLDIDSPWLSELNERVSKLPNEDKHPVYHPHCTVAYVKKGVATKLAGIDPFATKEVKPQFTAAEMEFKGACEQDDDPDRVVEVIRFSTQKEPQVKEAFDPDAIDPKEYAHKTPLEYAVQMVGPKGEEGVYLAQQGEHHLNPAWMGLRSLRILQKYNYGNRYTKGAKIPPGYKIQILRRPRLKEALDPDAIDPKQYLKKAVRWPCAKCGRDLGAPESVIREYFSRHGHDPLHSLGHYDAEGSFEPDHASEVLSAELHGYDLADDSDSCSACGESTMEKIQEALEEAVDPDAVDPKQALKNVGVHYAIRKIGNPKLPSWWWNGLWGWGAHRARQRFDSRIEADDMIRERGLQGVGEVVPIIEETHTPDPFGGLSFPTDASQVVRFLRKKRHRRPAIL